MLFPSWITVFSNYLDVWETLWTHFVTSFFRTSPWVSWCSYNMTRTLTLPLPALMDQKFQHWKLKWEATAGATAWCMRLTKNATRFSFGSLPHFHAVEKFLHLYQLGLLRASVNVLPAPSDVWTHSCGKACDSIPALISGTNPHVMTWK